MEKNNFVAVTFFARLLRFMIYGFEKKSSIDAFCSSEESFTYSYCLLANGHISEKYG